LAVAQFELFQSAVILSEAVFQAEHRDDAATGVSELSHHQELQFIDFGIFVCENPRKRAALLHI